MSYYSLSIDEVLNKLKTSKHGLSEKEAESRLNKYGKNVLPRGKRFSKLEIFINQFKSVLIYVLLIATVISFVLKETTDAYVILTAVIVNVIIGYFQENKAEEALALLRQSIKQYSIVYREGKEKEVDSTELVVGDVLICHAGDKIPADARIIKLVDLQVNESPLTGESYPVKKSINKLKKTTSLADRINMLYTGTVLTSGRAEAVVCAIGSNTEMGKIATLIKETDEERTPLQNKLDEFSKSLGIIILIITVLLFLFGVAIGKDAKEMFLTAVAMAVSAIPEGLVVAVTAILAIGMQRILKRKALVRNLVAAETLGSITYICTDKTGTLTIGDMRVSKIITYNHDLNTVQLTDSLVEENLSPLKLLKIGLLSNDAHIENPNDEAKDWVVFGSPTEKALLLAGTQIGLKQAQLNKQYPRLDEIPFNSDLKYMITLHNFNSANHLYIKGAPEKILKMCSKIDLDNKIEDFDEGKQKEIQSQFRKLSNQGLRILAFAYQVVGSKIKKISEIENSTGGYIFVGFVGVKDPLRSEASETIKICKKAGIVPVMITGDHKLTAQAIAKELGIPSKNENILTGEELQKMNDHQFNKIISKISVYARVTPADKIRIVKTLQSKGEVVAMTGDGVNDAPALKAANIGIGLGSGTDVSKEMSDIVLNDNNFKTIINAIEEGRVIYENIKKMILYLLSDSFTELILIISSLILGLPLPILASQILWVNLIDDTLPNLALTMDKGSKDILLAKPRSKDESIMSRDVKLFIFFVSIITGFANLILFYILIQNNSIEIARTIIFCNIGVDSLLYIFSCRNLRKSIMTLDFIKNDLFSNMYIIVAIAISFILQLVAIYIPFFRNVLQTEFLYWSHWILIAIFNISIIWLIEIFKKVIFIKK